MIEGEKDENHQHVFTITNESTYTKGMGVILTPEVSLRYGHHRSTLHIICLYIICVIHLTWSSQEREVFRLVGGGRGVTVRLAHGGKDSGPTKHSRSGGKVDLLLLICY